VKQKLILMIALVMLVPLAGCWELEGPPPPDAWGSGRVPTAEYDPALETSFTAANAALSGDMGSVESFSVHAGDVQGYRDGYGFRSLTIEATTEAGALVMGILYFDDRVLDQPVGTTRTYASLNYEAAPGDEDEPFMDVTGCSGENGMIDYDVPADQVDVTLEPSSTNPDMQTVRFVATFGDQRASGSFDVTVPDESGSTAPGR